MQAGDRPGELDRPLAPGDRFGRRYATSNYGLLYTAKGTATGTWMPIFAVAIVFDVRAAVLALFVLKPLCARVLAVGSASAAQGSAVIRPVSVSR